MPTAAPVFAAVPSAIIAADDRFPDPAIAVSAAPACAIDRFIAASYLANPAMSTRAPSSAYTDPAFSMS